MVTVLVLDLHKSSLLGPVMPAWTEQLVMLCAGDVSGGRSMALHSRRISCMLAFVRHTFEMISSTRGGQIRLGKHQRDYKGASRLRRALKRHYRKSLSFCYCPTQEITRICTSSSLRKARYKELGLNLGRP
jgi:hypothetical protein